MLSVQAPDVGAPRGESFGVAALVICLLVASAAVGAPRGAQEPCFVWGELDGNGQPGAVDASLLLQWDAFLIDRFPVYPDVVFPDFPPAADVDGNGVAGAVDAAHLLRFDAFIIDCLPADTDCDGRGPEGVVCDTPTPTNTPTDAPTNTPTSTPTNTPTIDPSAAVITLQLNGDPCTPGEFTVTAFVTGVPPTTFVGVYSIDVQWPEGIEFVSAEDGNAGFGQDPSVSGEGLSRVLFAFSPISVFSIGPLFVATLRSVSATGGQIRFADGGPNPFNDTGFVPIPHRYDNDAGAFVCPPGR